MIDARIAGLDVASDVTSLETDRLTLRRHVLADFDESAAMWADPIVTRHIGGRPFTREEVWTKLLRYVGHWQLLGFGYWVVREKSSRDFVGEVGFADFKREMVPSLEGMAEIGWVLASRAHGKGYATEAVRAAIAWCDERLCGARTACIIDPDNALSIRVARKCGYDEKLRTTYKGSDVILYERAGGQRDERAV
jgi:RimJ/RimL family protein N-acetyltransferase